MKEIKIVSKKHGLHIVYVDDVDFEWISKKKWCIAKVKNLFYTTRNIVTEKGKSAIRMHREILNIKNPKIEVDHKDNNPLNNQRHNLRLANRHQNNANKSSKINGTSKYLGVCWDKSRNKWKADITKNRKNKYLGRFENEVDAALVYNNAAIIYHGEFANLNKITAS